MRSNPTFTLLFKSLLFLSILVYLLNLATPLFFRGEDDKYYQQRSYYLEKPNSFDAVFLGASSIYYGVNPLVLWAEYGISSYNRASLAQSGLVSYFRLKELLKTQRPKVIFLTPTYLVNFEKGIYNTVDEAALDTMPLSSTKIALVAELMRVMDPGMVTELLPAISNHNKWKKLDRENISRIFAKVLPTKGAGISLVVEPQQIREDRLIPTERTLPYHLDHKVYYDQLIDLAKEQNIRVVILVLPRMDWTYAFHNTFQNYARERNVELLDMNLPDLYETIAINPAKDYFDFVHLNIAGMVKVNQTFGKLLLTEYGLPSHKGEVDFGMWDAEYLEYVARYPRINGLIQKSR